jgi:gamma-glutamyltranspeptidase / glutathione hydrolase
LVVLTLAAESLSVFLLAMKRQTIAWICVLSWLAAPLATPIAAGQTAPSFQARTGNRELWPKQAVRGAHAIVATDEALGSQAGVEILKRGGNAVDAGVAVAFALAVVEPAAGNIGGGGFMLVRLADGRTSFLDYREVAPGKATRNMYTARWTKRRP